MKATLDAMQAWLKDETTSELFLQDLRALANFIYGWWDTRNKREGAFCYPWNRHLSACQPVCFQQQRAMAARQETWQT